MPNPGSIKSDYSQEIIVFSINKAKIEKWEKKKKINKLICALERTDNFDIRVEAAKALHRIGRGGVAITKLREGLFDDNENVRKEAAEALANISVHVLIEEGERCSFCLLYTSPSPRDGLLSRMPSSA